MSTPSPVRPHAALDAGIALLSFEDNAAQYRAADPHIHEIRLHLNDVRELFFPPEYDPFAIGQAEKSGLERIVDTLKPTRLEHKLRVVITLPGGIDDTLFSRTLTAIRRYTQARIDENRVELASLRWQGLKALQTGIIFLAICLALSTAAGLAEFLPEALRNIFSEGFLIAGWVSLWHPVEILLYEWWPLWRQIHLYERIRDMELELQAA